MQLITVRFVPARTAVPVSRDPVDERVGLEISGQVINSVPVTVSLDAGLTSRR